MLDRTHCSLLKKVMTSGCAAALVRASNTGRESSANAILPGPINLLSQDPKRFSGLRTS